MLDLTLLLYFLFLDFETDLNCLELPGDTEEYLATAHVCLVYEVGTLFVFLVVLSADF